HTLDGRIEWLSLTGRKPSGMSLQQWKFMQTAMPDIKQLLLEGKNIRADEKITELIKRQREFTEGVPLPSIQKIEAERWYNRLVRPALAGSLAVSIGLFGLIIPLYRSKNLRIPCFMTDMCGWILLLYVATSMGVLWWISGHVPLSNGSETMMFMAFVSLIGVCFCRDLTLKGGLMIVAAMALFVAAMGGRTPRIGNMMPVLSSPLLSIHVMVVMSAYALFFLMAILAIMALSIKDKERGARLTLLNRIILNPAVALLGAGIFIGAVWANQTWGRYWGWDPKETCALIMWLIYALPLHWGSRWLSVFRKEKIFNIYLLIAILSVIFTYFGANYLLSGLHSYA
ncbi:MAG: cytochrome c biogenesis protein CcsA, partial [Muribaculaceae bacterium]|nr:cytochrome c biogenesis protein CcsA [Muribaculaceae bacterium]